MIYANQPEPNATRPDNLTLAEVDRHLAAFISSMRAAPVDNTGKAVIVKYIREEIMWLDRAIAGGMNGIASESLLKLAAACMICHARILQEAKG
jgi:hypothetical protein